MSAIPIPKPAPPTASPRPALVVYPESDGKPMSDNMKQRRWIMRLHGNLLIRHANDPDVLVTADLLWYAVEGFPEVRAAPDVMVVFGRPKHDRGSYLQWLEDDVAPQVVFEILSPGNDYAEMQDKYNWYEEFGVEEYYVFDPNRPDRLFVYLREGAIFRPVKSPHGFVSPRMGIRFDLSGPEMEVFYPDGRRFLDVQELDALRAEAERRAADALKQAAEADKRATDADKRAAEAERLRKRERELTRKAQRGEASAEELAELERLQSEP
jgi:Uma2 family endonuclease